MDKINNINNVKPQNVFKQKQRSYITTHPIPQDSFEKSDNTDTSKKKKVILVLGAIVGIFGLYKGAKGLSKYLKTKMPRKKIDLIEAPKNPATETVKNEIRVLEPTKIEKPKLIEAPKETKIDTTQIKEAEIIEIKPKTIAKEVESITSSPAVKDIVETKTILPTEKAKQLAEEYKQLIEKRDFRKARQVKLELNDEGFVIFNDKLVHKCSKEAFSPLRVIPTEEISSIEQLERGNPIKCPGIIKSSNPNILKPAKPENFGIDNIGVRYYRGGDNIYYREGNPLMARAGGMSRNYMENDGKRIWIMGHDYLTRYPDRKYRYVTTLTFNEGLNSNGRPHGFILSLEGDYSVETIEALKNRLIETGLANEFVIAETEAKEIMGKIVDEVITFMNKK